MQLFGPFKGCFQRLIEAYEAGMLCGFIPAAEANSILNNRQPGTYLVRYSKSKPGCFALTFLDAKNVTKHCLLYSMKPGFTLTQPPKVFYSLIDFVDAYKSKLKYPVGRETSNKDDLQKLDFSRYQNNNDLKDDDDLSDENENENENENNNGGNYSEINDEKNDEEMDDPFTMFPNKQNHLDNNQNSQSFNLLSNSSVVNNDPNFNQLSNSNNNINNNININNNNNSNHNNNNNNSGMLSYSSELFIQNNSNRSMTQPIRYNRNSLDNDDRSICIICYKKARDILFLDCKHLVCCHECFPKLNKECPICRGPITSTIKIKN